VYIGRSAKSRLGKIVAVGDISYSEVTNFLCKKEGKSSELTDEIYNLVGGRIKLIESIIRDLNDDVAWAGRLYIL